MPASNNVSVASYRPPQQMTCMEVWGGSQLTTRGVAMGGLDAWVYSKPFGDGRARRGCLLRIELRHGPHHAPVCWRMWRGTETRSPPLPPICERSCGGSSIAWTKPNLCACSISSSPRFLAGGHFCNGRRGHIFCSYAAIDRLQRRPPAAASVPRGKTANGHCWARNPRT